MLTPLPFISCEVPASTDREILTAYKTASNWSSYADYMYERNY